MIRGVTRHLPRVADAAPLDPERQCFAIGIWPGDGIGPEVIAASLLLLDVIEARTGLRFVRHMAPELSPEVRDATDAVSTFAQSVFEEDGALLCGPVSGRAIYRMRQRLGLYCKLTPILPMPALRGTGPLAAAAVDGVDILMVRENLAGLYQGECKVEARAGGRHAEQVFGYGETQVRDIVLAAAGIAEQRRGQLTVIYKPGGAPSISALWHDVASEVCRQRGLAARYLEVDNAAYQLIADARAFDVVVAPNMFGDVLADTATLLLGSRGLSYSANFDAAGHGVYQTGHGAAHDLKRLDCANPLGQMQSLAMMLGESFGLTALAEDIRESCNEALADGWRTRDVMASPGRSVGTQEFGAHVARALDHRLQSGRTATLRPVRQAG